MTSSSHNTEGKSLTSMIEEKVEENFDIAGLFLEYLSNWKWFLLSVVICIACAWYYIATIIPIYQVSASVYLSGNNVKTNAVSISGAELVSNKDYIDETEIEILKSRNNMMKIVDSLNLCYSYYESGRFRNVPLYGNNPIVVDLDSVSLQNLSHGIYIEAEKTDEGYSFEVKTSYNNQSEHRVFTAKKLPAKVEISHGTLTFSESRVAHNFTKKQIITITPPGRMATRLSSMLSIQFAPNSGTILRISFRCPVIRQGIDVINTLLAFYNADIIEEKNRSAIQTEAFILDRLVMISSELRDVEERLEQYRSSNNIIDLGTQTRINLSNKSDNENQLANVAVQQEILNAVEKTVTRQDDYAPIIALVDNSDLRDAIDAYNRKLSQRDRMLKASTEDNPTVQSMQQDLDNQRSIILQSVTSAKANLATRKASITAQNSRTSGQLASLPPIDKGLQEIFREQQVKVNIYTFLLQKREEIALQKTLATATARLIDNPVGSGPVFPRSSTIYGMAILIGLCIPAILIFLRRLIFPVFKDKEEVERSTSVPVISEICNIHRTDKKVVISAKDTSPEAELFRLLRNNIQFILGTGHKVILVTSSLSGEGKTFVATNIAMSFALTGKKTIVIGADIRRPILAHNFNLDNHQGLTTYLCGQTDNWKSLISPSGINDSLFVLPAGPVPPNPNELLLSDRLDNLIENLKQEYEYIIIDSAPIGLVSDSLLISRLSDIQLYVARANYSTRRCIKMMHNAIESGRFNRPYIILNGVEMRSNSYRYRHYGSYGYYGAGSTRGYGYGYSETPLPSSRIKKIWRKAFRK